MSYICPVCGYPELTKSTDFGSFEICSSCRFQFDVTDRDRGYTYEQWREKWIAEGMIWDKGSSKPPEGWDPKKQLLNIGVKLQDN